MGPLSGCRVAVTRPQGRGDELVALLQQAGARVEQIPLIRIEPPEDPQELERQARAAWAGEFDWLVVTSPEGARVLAQALDRQRPAGAGVLPARLCAVGPATARTLQEMGYPASVVPGEARGAAIPDALQQAQAAAGLAGCRVLWAVADRADPGPAEELARRGARVVRVVAYRTVPDDGAGRELARRLLAGELDVVVLASPSAVAALAQGLRQLGAASADGPRVHVVAIGPTTAQACRQAGFSTRAAEAPTPQALYDAVATWWRELATRKG